ncbi:vitamin K-dependent protein Z-like isoform X2 [Bufo gargarizans]|uniref:vitamin K-dependent protein Z-like isoform X2 n=1 Tax=Bufo gargarizans TaxID=30331 RepID=UPI001CF25052|nr:vitamin K-dependent protein Z-like isoform X2 [Bufo gargarizans]
MSKMANSMQTLCISFLLVLIQRTQQTVFLSSEKANQVIQRTKRANYILLEEIWQGNLEQECLEEICTYEEAREIFEDIDKTQTFWKSYHASNECYPDAEDGCQHFCEPNHELDFYTCSCASSYSLGDDEKSCHPTGPYACGQLLYNENSSLLGIQDNYTNSFPWQVLLLNSDGKPYCSGVILNQFLVLTTVKCSNQEGPIFILVGHNDTQNMQKIKVASHRIHTGHSNNAEDHNIALLKLEEGIKFHKHILPICIPQKDFAENVLIAHAPGMVSGWTLGSDDMEMVPIQFAVTETDKQTCETAFNVTQSKRNFCGRSNRKIDSALADGSHVAIKHKGTWFLTGIMGSINNELWNPNVFTFTRISRYIMWLKENSS